ncbi:MAG TPA: tetratricopeptide repeat protein [Polyangiaceae bacterium]|nr:tetratricopeptide repeat protein [Polyangiaceae bacterium]
MIVRSGQRSRAATALRNRRGTVATGAVGDDPVLDDDRTKPSVRKAVARRKVAGTNGNGKLSTRTPEAYLHKATHAQTPTDRAKYATRGLAQPGLDDTTQAMLLRQLYLAHMEGRRFELALEVSRKMIDLRVLPDAARQDAARACLGLGRPSDAISHLRVAGRVAPASRRAFHAWTLGSTLYLLGRETEAVGPLERALRWSTNAQPLYAAQLALAQLGAGEPHESLRVLWDALHDAPCGQGYGQFVLGELACKLGENQEARRCLEGFIRRTNSGRVALAVGLSAEVRRAEALLEELPPESSRSSQ